MPLYIQDMRGGSEVKAGLCRAEHQQELVGILLDYIEQSTPRCLLFIVDSLTASIEDWRGMHLSQNTARNLRLDVTTDPLFGLLAGSDHYHGSVPQDSPFEASLGRLGIDLPGQILIVPAYFDDRIAIVLYAEESDGRPIPVDRYRRLMDKVGVALALLTLKDRIGAI